MGIQGLDPVIQATQSGRRVWTVLAVVDVNGSTDPVSVVADLFTSGTSEAQVRVRSDDQTSRAVLIAGQATRTQFEEVENSQAGRVTLEARVINGNGRVHLSRATAMTGAGLAPEAVDHFLAATPDLTRTEGATFVFPTPNHNGETLLLFKSDGVGGFDAAPLAIAGLEIADSGTYRYISYFDDGTELTDDFVLTVSAVAVTPLTIVRQPDDDTIATGSTVYLVSEAAGPQSIRSEWFEGATSLGAGTGPVAELTIGPITANREFFVVFTDDDTGATLNSATSTITVTAAPADGPNLTDIERT